jgi:hypothetical protein
MRPILIVAVGILTALTAASHGLPARAQQEPGQFSPSEVVTPPANKVYPDAVICDVTSPDAVTYRMIFYKGQTVSFATEPNNAAEYGTTFVRDPDKFDASVPYKWRLQLGRPSNITAFTLPSGWTNVNCPVGKTIDKLKADKQILKIFTVE